MVSESSPGSVLVFPLQRSVLRKRKARLLAPFLPLLCMVLVDGAQGEAMGGLAPECINSALFQRKAVIYFNSLYRR